MPTGREGLYEVFNPLDKTHLGESVAETMLHRPIGPLPPSEAFLALEYTRYTTKAISERIKE